MKLSPLKMVNRSRLILLLGLLLINPPVFAADEVPPAEQTQETAETAKEDTQEKPEEERGYRLVQNRCDFELVLPSEPYSSRRCDESGTLCYNVTTFTQVYDMKTTVDISISCNDSTPEEYRRYDEGLMRTAMKGMVRRNNLDDAEISYKNIDDVHMANLSATGKTGRQDQIYIAQLWISEYSVFTLEAHLVGQTHHEADKAFSDILRSIEYKPKDHSSRKQKPKTTQPGNN